VYRGAVAGKPAGTFFLLNTDAAKNNLPPAERFSSLTRIRDYPQSSAIFSTCYKELDPLGDCGFGRKIDFVSPQDRAKERNSLVDA
jgi:hypothetical protein